MNFHILLARIATGVLCAHFLGSSILQAQTVTPLPNLRWSWRDPSLTGEDLHAVASNAGTVVVVGNAGTIALSTDGINWVLANSPTSENLWSVAWAGTEFLAVGENGTLLASVDGFSWTAHTLGIGISLEDRCGLVHGAGGTFLSANGRAFRSLDRRVFEPVASLPANISRISWAKDRYFVAAGSNLYSSYDGSNWAILPGAPAPHEVIWSGTHFLGLLDRDLAISSDGVTWRTRPSGNYSFYSISAHNSSFLAISQTYHILMSGRWSPGLDDPILSEVRSYPRFASPTATHHTGEYYVMVGGYGSLITTFDGRISAWPRRVSLPAFEVAQLAAGPGQFYAMASGALYTSGDGRVWDARSAPFEITRIHPDGVALSAENGIWQWDGLAWTLEEQIEPAWPARLYDYSGIGGARYVAMAGKILKRTLSVDRWVSREVLSAPAEFFTGVEDDENGLLATTMSGKLFTSPDGDAWTPAGETGFPARRLASNGRNFVVASDAFLYTSENGQTWTQKVALGEMRYPPDVTWDGAQYLASGGALFFESADGETWTSRRAPRPGYVAYNGSTYVALSERGILQSELAPPSVSVQELRLTETTLEFSIPFRPSLVYRIYRSADLQTWDLVSEHWTPNAWTGAAEIVQFSAPRVPGPQFYAVKANVAN